MRNPLTILAVSIRTAYVLLFIGFVIAISGCSGGSSSTVSNKNDTSPINIGGINSADPSPPSNDPSPPSNLSLSLSSPSTSPNSDPTPEILVSGVEPLATVELYSDSSCQVSTSSPVSVQQERIKCNH